MISTGTLKGSGKTYREHKEGGRWAKVMVSVTSVKNYIAVAVGNHGEYIAWEVTSVEKQKDAVSIAKQWVQFGYV